MFGLGIGALGLGRVMSTLLPESAFERHYSVEELTELWGMSDDFVRRLFLDEPGVVVFFKPRSGRRVYRILRIPESVVQRVHRRLRREETR